jgi:hypothetical protein
MVIKNLKTKIKAPRIDKKIRYGIVSIVLVVVLFFASNSVPTEEVLFLIVTGLVLFSLVVLLLSQLVFKKSSSDIFLVILLVHLVVGFLISLFYFPNLGPLVMAVAFIGVGLLTYTVLLVNNVFVVTEEREGLIPLYNAALTWAQVLIVVISIAYFTGIFKIPSAQPVQNLSVLVSTFLFCSYMLWAMSFDPDAKKTSYSEKISLSTLLSFITFLAALSVSYIPTESFLRGLFISSIVMFDLAYIVAHYKNRIRKRMFIEYGTISLIFFIILLIFRP